MLGVSEENLGNYDPLQRFFLDFSHKFSEQHGKLCLIMVWDQGTLHNGDDAKVILESFLTDSCNPDRK